MTRYRIRIEFDAPDDAIARAVCEAITESIDEEGTASTCGAELLKEATQPWRSYDVLTREGTLWNAKAPA